MRDLQRIRIHRIYFYRVIREWLSSFGFVFNPVTLSMIVTKAESQVRDKRGYGLAPIMIAGLLKVSDTESEEVKADLNYFFGDIIGERALYCYQNCPYIHLNDTDKCCFYHKRLLKDQKTYPACKVYMDDLKDLLERELEAEKNGMMTDG